MKDLQQLLATEEGEDQVLRRMQIIDMARGLMNSLVIDKDGEEYDFKTFQFAGVSNVISASCNMLSAITNIPQTILFGQAVGGLSTTDDTAMENYYNYVQRIQRRMLKSNLRYLLSIIFQAGLSTGEVDEVPKIKVEFNPLWSLSDVEQADLEQKKAATQHVKAQTAQIYVDMQALDPPEVRKSLASSDEFDVEEVLDEDTEDDLFPPDLTSGAPDDEEEEGNSPDAAPAATRLPEDMSEEEFTQAGRVDDARMDAYRKLGNKYRQRRMDAAGDTNQSVGVLVVKDGQILCGIRGRTGHPGMVCGPGGHVKEGESFEQAAMRETEEEFGIKPKELLQIGYGPVEAETGSAPALFLCTDYEGIVETDDNEMLFARFMEPAQVLGLIETGVAFQPFADSVRRLLDVVGIECGERGKNLHNRNDTLDNDHQKVIIKLSHPPTEDGGPGSGNFGHKGVPGQVGGSTPAGSAEGRNKPCTGFGDKSAEKRHKKHWREFDVSSNDDYVKLANELFVKPVGGSIDGYMRKDGTIVRFDTDSGVFVAGIPKGELITFFKPKYKNGKPNVTKANMYFDADKKEEMYEP